MEMVVKRNKVDAKKILGELKEKARQVEWFNSERKEKYGIFAKSFKKRIKQEGVYLFDLEDIQKGLD